MNDTCTNCTKSDVANFILRISLAAIFAIHGVTKIQGWAELPNNLLRFAAVAEVIGAIGLLVWCLARYAAIGLSIVMLGAIYHHFFIWGDKFAKAELAIVLFFTVLTIAISGASKCGLACRMCSSCKTCSTTEGETK